MNYTDFKNTYKKLIKKYSDISYLWGDIKAPYKITETTEQYIKSGSCWKLSETKTNNISYEFYCNVVDPSTLALFRNLGGFERVSASYTIAGYIPIEVVSISPSKTQKTIRKYKIDRF